MSLLTFGILRCRDLSIWISNLKITDLTISNAISFVTSISLTRNCEGHWFSFGNNCIPSVVATEDHSLFALVHVNS